MGHLARRAHAEQPLYVDSRANSTYKSPVPPPIPPKTRRITMARASDPIDPIARFLAQSEHSPLTIKNYRSDLDAFAVWFQSANGEPMEPAKVTPTDLRQFKRSLVEQRRLKPNTVNRKLATLKSFLTWATRA